MTRNAFHTFFHTKKGGIELTTENPKKWESQV